MHAQSKCPLVIAMQDLVVKTNHGILLFTWQDAVRVKLALQLSGSVGRQYANQNHGGRLLLPP